MNVNITVQCETCDTKIACRVGMSNRDVQPFRFSCPVCSSPIDMTFHKTDPAEFVGASLITEPTVFSDEIPFVDLHLDFPVTFDKYVMGMTPFIKAAQRIGFKLLRVHQARLNQLNATEDKIRVFALLIKLYINEKLKPFKLSCQRNFDLPIKSDRPEDINAALYVVIAMMMWPFAMPGDNEESVEHITETLIELGREKPGAMKTFMDEVIGTKFLKNLQIDCLEIYPRILEGEITLRPALFLDFDSEYHNNPIPMRVSHAAFEDFKDLYKDISEIISKQLVLVAGINNLIKRDGHDHFMPGIGKAANGKDNTPKSLEAFADVPFGNKIGLIDDVWFDALDGGADNKLRNAIAHHKTEYNEVTQVITYYPKREGIKQEKGETISFLDFMHQLLITYREMHRLHQLIKCLFNFHYLAPQPKRDDQTVRKEA
jgi:hypothetical protein